MLKVKRVLSLTFGLAAMTYNGHHVYDTILFVQRNWKPWQSMDVQFMTWDILRLIIFGRLPLSS